MRFLMVFALICGWACQATAAVQFSLSASDSTWLVPAGGSVVGYTDFYLTVRYDGVAPSQNYILQVDFFDGGVLTGDPPLHFSAVPLWDELSGAWFPLPASEISPYLYPDSHRMNLAIYYAWTEGTDWPVGEITKPFIRINYVLDPSVDTSLTAQWQIGGYAIFSGSGNGDDYNAPWEATTTNQITALVVPAIPEPLSVLVWGGLAAVAGIVTYCRKSAQAPI